MKTPIGGEDVCALVIQIGGCSVRVGYAQEDHPRIHAAAAVGRRRLRLPANNSSHPFCDSCCCCESRAAATAPPDVATESSSSTSAISSSEILSQQQDQQRWRKGLGVSSSVFYNRGPFVWKPEGRSCCSCNCCHPDLLFPVNLGVATPHTEVTSILSSAAATATGAIAAKPDEAPADDGTQAKHQERHLDREAFSRAARICIEGHVTEEEAQRRTIRPPGRQQQQPIEEAKQQGPGCNCCCAKQQQQQQQQQSAADCNGRCGGPPDSESNSEHMNTDDQTSSNSSSICSSNILEAFGCSPFGGLGVWTHEHPVLVVEPTLSSPSLRRSLAAAVFEDLQAPAAFFAPAAAAAAFAMGRSSALVVELGSAGGSVAAVSDGYLLRRSARSFAVGGAFMDKQIELVLLQQLQQLQQRQQGGTHPGLDFNSQQRLLLPLFSFAGRGRPRDLSYCSSSLLWRSTEELVRQIREACCVVRRYADASLSLSPVPQGKEKGAADTLEDPFTQYELPDGTPIDCSGIRHAVGELLFQPTVALQALQLLQPPALRKDPEELLQGFSGLPNVRPSIFSRSGFRV